MNEGQRAPILVLGVGNALLQDDGVGLALVTLASKLFSADARLEFVDGGTLGLGLMGWIEGRRALLVLDAVALGAAPGTVHVVEHPLEQRALRGLGAHGGNASSLLGNAALLGLLPRHVAVIGVEPRAIRTGTELDERVKAALPAALARVQEWLESRLAELPEAACTS